MPNVPSDGSPIDDHFQHVEEFSSNIMPTDPKMLKPIWSLFTKLAKAPTISESSLQLFNWIALSIGDVVFNHGMHQLWYNLAATDLN